MEECKEAKQEAVLHCSRRTYQHIEGNSLVPAERSGGA